MFNIGFSELMVILLVALIFVGPKDLPKVGAYLGRTVKKLKRFIAECKDEMNLGEMEKEYKDTVADIKSTVRAAEISEPLRQIAEDIRQSGGETASAAGQTQSADPSQPYPPKRENH